MIVKLEGKPLIITVWKYSENLNLRESWTVEGAIVCLKVMLAALKKMIGYEQCEAYLVNSNLVFIIFLVMIILWHV